MVFNKLLCIDDTFYRCNVRFVDSGGVPRDATSNNISISVQVTPSKPDRIFWIKVFADSSSTTSTVPMSATTSSSSSAVTTKLNETISTMDSDEQNDTTASTHSTLPTTDHKTTSSTPSDEYLSTDSSYRTTTHSIQQTTTAQGIAEGDNITVVCTGDVGKPAEKHVFQKYRNGHNLSMTYTATETSISEMSENCSYYRRSNLTFQVMSRDNNAVIRCVVNSSMAEPDMYVETEPIEVYYEVSMPTIIKYPNKAYYVVGEDTSIHLTCKSDGNPKPNYQWYKENHKERISTNENLNITDMNVTNSGVYTCKVSNTFNGGTFTNSTDLQVNIMNKVDISTTQSSSTGSSSGVDDKKEKPDENSDLYTAIGIVSAVVIVIIIIFLIVMIARKKRKSKSPTIKNESKSSVDSKKKQVTESRTGDYDYIALEDDATKKQSVNNGLEVEDIKEHNKEYLKKQEEEEQKKNESNTPPQPAVYAQVNEATKSRNKQNTETRESSDKQEEDAYAETQDGIYDKAGDRRHKENENVEHFDSSNNSSKQNSNGDNKLSIQTNKVGSYANQAFEKDENRKVATVSPTIRSSSGSQNDEPTNLSRNSQSKKGFENIISTDQTGTSEEDSFHRTAL
ncbi:serine-rich adhesin for platelets-like isoform X1 [Mytilus californianus]|uniref:serine-rich adhesin for platelets-like isoform X1 n=1 Tax=Mytilus californianus TaxID=6549 RepID=UPI00224566B1|nr:serine-rich adhesin for platelets-like isoform X1 [Mytilus californianus]